jgi:hypothetical protein
VARLKDLRAYLDDRRRLVNDIEARLCALQAKYESFFAEVATAHDSELEQLIGHATGERSALPEWFTTELEAERVAVERELDEQVQGLEKQRAGLSDEAEAQRRHSAEDEAELRRQNVDLDAEEEALKARGVKLVAAIEDYNRRIKGLASGFGFFANLFRMRALQGERAALDLEQADVAARVDSLRARWVKVSTEYDLKEQARTSQWTKLETEAAAVSAKLEALAAARPRMVVRSAVERVLDRRRTAFRDPASGAPCPRCAVLNPPQAHFCHICAQRLTEDRPDLAGSLEEMAELNHHYRRFQEGMRACQEIIGLVRGLGSGVDAFTKSVDDMIASEDKYPLAKLKLEVPEASRAWGSNLELFRGQVSADYSLHPQELAATVQTLIQQVFTEDAIRAYFESMGEELSRQAKAQWE